VPTTVFEAHRRRRGGAALKAMELGEREDGPTIGRQARARRESLPELLRGCGKLPSPSRQTNAREGRHHPLVAARGRVELQREERRPDRPEGAERSADRERPADAASVDHSAIAPENAQPFKSSADL